jgi:hypothetical protein
VEYVLVALRYFATPNRGGAGLLLCNNGHQHNFKYGRCSEQTELYPGRDYIAAGIQTGNIVRPRRNTPPIAFISRQDMDLETRSFISKWFHFQAVNGSAMKVAWAAMSLSAP